VAFIGRELAVSGDLLFAGSIGRTDLPLSDPADMERSLARLATLPDALRILPGHGPETTIGRERLMNPFLNGTARVRRG
jgi:glyoxylase-like metal-dependent hydrolase (beta-lactamase superfamily II)